MKLNKIMLLSLLSVGALFSACSEDDNYEMGKPAGNNAVSFANEENIVLDFEATDFDVELVRVGDNLPALTVPITVLNAPDFVKVPASVSFAAGETEARIKVEIGEGMEAFTDYNLSLMFDEEYTNPYLDTLALSPRYNITFLKEDYVAVGRGMFHETVYFEEEWEVEFEYSELLDLYRIPDAIIEGTHWYFKWNGPDAEEQVFYFTDSTGKKASVTISQTNYYGWFSGITNPTYGPVYVCVLDGNFIGYNPEGEGGPEFDFPVAYRVSAGSFGSSYEWIDQLEFY